MQAVSVNALACSSERGLMRFGTIMFAVAMLLTVAPHAFSTTVPGDQAPLFSAVDENMESFEMSDFIDGTPLVFFYGSAT